jgi:hypothetical protein
MMLLIYGLVGWLLCQLWIMQSKQKEYDLDRNGYSWSEIKAFGQKNSISILFGLILSILITVTHQAEALWYWCFDALKWDRLEFIELFNALAGAASAGVQFGLSKLGKKVK